MRPFHECFRGLMRMLRPHGARVLLSVLIGFPGIRVGV